MLAVPNLPHRSNERDGESLELTAAFRAWVIENALDGVEPAALVASLEAKGVPTRLAAREVESLLASPAMAGARALHQKVRRLEMAHGLAAELRRMRKAPRDVPRRTAIDAAEFYERYYAGNEPIVLTDMARRWPAVGKWSPRHF